MELLNTLLTTVEFDSYESFYRDFHVNVPENFNFARDVVDRWAAIDKGKRALVWTDDTGETLNFTFEDISRLSKQCANALRTQGIGEGDRVLLLLRRRWEYWVIAVALHRMGAVLIPASVQLTRKDIEYRANEAGVSAIIAAANEPGTLAEIDAARPAFTTVRLLATAGGRREGYAYLNELMEWASTQCAPPNTHNGDIMLIYFTSGTTGMPKMAAHDHTYPLGHITTARYWQRVADNGLHYTASDSGWAKFGWGCIYGQWIAGTAILGYDMDKFVPAKLLNVVRRLKPTTFCVPPTMYRFLMKEGVTREDFASVTHSSTAGEPLSPEVHKEFEAITGLSINEGLGQSESSVMLGTYPWYKAKPGSMGKPSPLYNVTLLNANGERCAVGEEGELVIDVRAGAPVGLLRGYITGGELKSPYEDGFYHTGDMAWMDEEGFYWFVGRNDDMIKCSGYRIGPFEVESVLLTHDAVLECAITGAPDEIRGQVVKASIVLAKGYAGSDALTKELQEYVKRLTAPYKYPRVIEYVSELPKTTSGKIMRAQIRGAGK